MELRLPWIVKSGPIMDGGRRSPLVRAPAVAERGIAGWEGAPALGVAGGLGGSVSFFLKFGSMTSKISTSTQQERVQWRVRGYASPN
ncbi:protein of unknown function [Candidatus Filomicrobium marinum]|uniref:Uncharacterized protein n=1 Tax=Candidatus Filomicrobium marinum TaxID=1608628 RepID=A0A0D6J9Y8_9HYPH|nr:protein of unknown function [Candidatus Filomicrobium marinum]CPR15303.1 protein of unknown function [Candidatus Filomicrobium marinum]